MDRYTQRISVNAGGVQINAAIMVRGDCTRYNAAVARLADYEDTNRTPDEVAALIAENAAFKADIEAGRMVRLESCDDCRYKTQSAAWRVYTYPCSELCQRTKSNFRRTETVSAENGGRENG